MGHAKAELEPCKPTGNSSVDTMRRIAGFLPIEGEFKTSPTLRLMDRVLLRALFGRPRREKPWNPEPPAKVPGEEGRRYVRAILAILAYKTAEREDCFDDAISFPKGYDQDGVDLPTPVRDAALTFIAAVAVWDEIDPSSDEGNLRLNPFRQGGILEPAKTPVGYLEEMVKQDCYSKAPRDFAQLVLDGLVRKEDLPRRLSELLDPPPPPAPESKGRRSKEETEELVARALLIIKRDPHITRPELAKELGVDPSTLGLKSGAWALVNAALKDRRGSKSSRPRGFKEADGDVEAVDPSSE